MVAVIGFLLVSIIWNLIPSDLTDFDEKEYEPDFYKIDWENNKKINKHFGV